MPKGLDEPCWGRAKAIATRYFGHVPNNDMEWAYTMGIYKHMCMTLPRGAKQQLPKQRQQKLGMKPRKQLKKRKGSRKQEESKGQKKLRTRAYGKSQGTLPGLIGKYLDKGFSLEEATQMAETEVLER